MKVHKNIDLKKLNIISFATFQSVLFALIGLVLGIIYSIGGFLVDCLVSLNLLEAENMNTPGLSYGTILALGAIIGMPVIAAIIGFALGILEAVLYNIFVKWFHLSPQDLFQ